MLDTSTFTALSTLQLPILPPGKLNEAIDRPLGKLNEAIDRPLGKLDDAQPAPLSLGNFVIFVNFVNGREAWALLPLIGNKDHPPSSVSDRSRRR